MKALLTVLTIILLVGVATTASAETKGGGFGVGAFDGDFGVQIRKDFWLGGEVSQITGQGSVYFAGKTTFRLDTDYHWVIQSDGGRSRFYPLAGVQLAFNSDAVKFGVNGGGGMNFMLTDSMAAFAEAKFTFFGWDGFAITGGFYF